MTHHRIKRRGHVLHVVVASSDCEFGQLQAKRDAELGERKDRRAQAITYRLPKHSLYLLFRPKFTLNDVAHEVYHAIQMLKFKTEEGAAVAAGDLTEAIWKHITMPGHA